jgi:hypothetical protein
MEFNLVEIDQVQETLRQCETSVQTLDDLHMAIIGGGCGEVIVG